MTRYERLKELMDEWDEAVRIAREKAKAVAVELEEMLEEMFPLLSCRPTCDVIELEDPERSVEKRNDIKYLKQERRFIITQQLFDLDDFLNVAFRLRSAYLLAPRGVYLEWDEMEQLQTYLAGKVDGAVGEGR